MIKRFVELLGKFGIGPQKDRIDDVTRMERSSRDTYNYIEGDHVLGVYAEMLVGKPDRAIDSDSLKTWLPPHHNEKISDTDRERILQKVCKYFEDRGHSCEIK